MNNGKNVLQLLLVLQNQLKSNQGVEAKPLKKALKTLDEAIAVLESAGGGASKHDSHKLVLIVTSIVKVLPSVIALISNHWKT